MEMEISGRGGWGGWGGDRWSRWRSVIHGSWIMSLVGMEMEMAGFGWRGWVFWVSVGVGCGRGERNDDDS